LEGLTLDPKGRFLYLTAAQGVEPYFIDDESGRLSRVQLLPTGERPSALLAIEPEGRFAYLPRGGYLWGYVIDPEHGAIWDLGRMGPGTGAVLLSRNPEE
jgi:6-phosphogluconolactonase (cycloisomerase 2 family)